MKIIYGIFLSLIICNAVHASPEKPLNTLIKDNNVCLYTNDKKSKSYDGRIYVYMGELDSTKGYLAGGYEKLYKNIKTPINQVDCLGINASNFKSNVPYHVSLDMESSYATRICLDKDKKPFVIKKVVNGFECESQLLHKNKKGFFQRLFEW